MPFRFSNLCQLLTDLEKIRLRNPPYLPKDKDSKERRIIEDWFRANRSSIDVHTTDGVALLSSLFPERRPDRKYALQEARLLKVIPRCLHLNSARTVALHAWNIPGNGDLGTCVERVLQDFDVEPKPGSPVTVEEVDGALQELASRSGFSGPEVRAERSSLLPHEILRPIYLRLKSSEAKWLTRLILKDLSPVVLNTHLVFRQFHFLLPGLLQFQNCFAAALGLLRGPLSRYHHNPDPLSQRLFMQDAAQYVLPHINVKVGRPPFYKARSLDHCIQMADGRQWSIERKYDGEYCEVHVNLERASNKIQIFSKSGKDSTKDRQNIHSTLRECLRIGKVDCAFKKRCIVLGELVVYSDKDEKILEFHNIRKHVSRSGRFIGTDEDSKPHEYEHLMLVFYDVLLIDDNVTMIRPHVERRKQLSQLIKKKPGYAITCEWKIHDFSKRGSRTVLAYQFVESIAKRNEGLVLKPSNSPYFSFDSSDRRSYFIKVKKDYMHEFGEDRDIADFAVVGASYDPKQAQKSGLKGLKYTNFYLGCLTNPEEVRFGKRPIFEVVGSIEQNQCISHQELKDLNSWAQFGSGSKTDVGTTVKNTTYPGMAVMFSEPCVVEVLGSGFERPQNKPYFVLRHPRILRLHLDRDWVDAIGLEDLQSLADKARNEPSQGESQEMTRLLEKIQTNYNKKRESQQRNRMLSTQCTERTENSLGFAISSQRVTGVNHSFPPTTRRHAKTADQKPVLVRIDTCELPPTELRAITSRTTNSSQISTQSQQPQSQKCTISLQPALLKGTASQTCHATVADSSLKSSPTLLAQSPSNAIPSVVKQGSVQSTPRRAPLQERQPALPTPASSGEQAKPQPAKPALGAGNRPSKRRAFETHDSFPTTTKRVKTGTSSREALGRTSKSFDQPATTLWAISEPSLRSPSPKTPNKSCWCGTEHPDLPEWIIEGSLNDAVMAQAFQGEHMGSCPLAKDRTAPKCPFEKSVIHVGKWIESCPVIKFDLVCCHGAERTDDLSHWVRENFTMHYPADEMAESQSHPGKHKMIIVNKTQEKPSRELVDEVLQKRVRDRVLWFDWRVLKEWKSVEESGQVKYDCFRKNYYGRTEWCDLKHGMVFVPAEEEGLELGQLFRDSEVVEDISDASSCTL